MDTAARIQNLSALRVEKDPLRRKLVALGILTDQLASTGLTPVLVGGSAVEFYTAGGYATKDVDLALPVSDAVDLAFRDLGFQKEGRYWYRADLDLLFEAPAGDLAGETSPRTTIEIDGWKIAVIGVEDLILDRLRAWVHWKSGEDERWTRRLVSLYRSKIDWSYLREKTAGNADEARAVDSLKKDDETK